MKKMIKYPSIKQFRNIIKDVKHNARFKGMDENNEPMFYTNQEMMGKYPVLAFMGTIKVHGTNGSFSYNDERGVWVQSRNNIITSIQDNAGFAFFIESIGNSKLKELFKDYYSQVDTNNNTVTIYGEFAGNRIQKGVAVSELEKMFYVFGVKVTPHNDKPSYWIWMNDDDFEHDRIHNIRKFGTYKFAIDFNDPSLIQQRIIDVTMEVEKECPVGKYFGVSGVGEGIVLSHLNDDGSMVTFKSKGEKHSISKVKKLVPIDVEKMNSIADFVDYAVTDNRLKQGWNEVFVMGNIEPTMKDTGKLLKWVNSDICKEEMDVLVENGLEFRDVVRASSTKTVDWFKARLDSEEGL